MRAPTPTGAAELAVPSTADLIERIKSIDIRLTRAVKNRTSQAKDRLVALQSSYAFRFPKRLQEQKEQQFDLVFDRFQKQLTRQIEQKRSQLDRQTYRLKPLHPKEQLLQAKKRHANETEQLVRSMNVQMKTIHSQFQSVLGKLNALNPLQVMERGYSLAYKDDELIKSVNQVDTKDQLAITMKDGRLICEVIEKEGQSS